MEKQLATFGGGCFCCTEALFKELKGVSKVVSGYSGRIIPSELLCQKSRQPYCQFVISPKLAKFRQKFSHLRRRSS